MTFNYSNIETIGIAGTGAMGRDIAWITSLAGLPVRLYGASRQAVAAACDRLSDTFAKLTAKGKLDGGAQPGLSPTQPVAADINEPNEARA